MDYTFKRGFKPDIDRIKAVLEEEFPSVREEDGKLVTSYGALKSITVWIEGKKMTVITEPDSDVGDELILETNKRFRKFLEAATGYNAKQRMKKAKKEAQKD